jgi:predicted small lipoprotein YifL
MHAAVKSSLAVVALAFLAACGAKGEQVIVTAPPSGNGAPAAAPVKVEASKDYPLKNCVVSGEPLGSMGAPQAYKVGDVEVQLCCAMCLAKFNADPAKYAAMVTAATKK